MSDDDTTAAEWVPARPSVRKLRAAAPDCRGCELWEDATQVVFSSGPPGAALVLVGEQPGDQEDRAGEPFVGPAGRLLDDA
ncbi:MAG TPA: uracil-DNA glycosylase family protein, partial [Nocardioides sp.]|nr:uracil-DNA glycosylase family protein [Nocardioides sp.]